MSDVNETSGPADRGELDGRVVLVTGASHGLGRAIVSAAAAAGATTLACGRDVTALEALADEVEARAWPSPVIVPVNLEAAGADDYALIASHVRERFARLDGLVLNAAMLGELAPLGTYDGVTWARVFQVNVHSCFLLVQALLPLLLDGDDAAIVFTLAEQARPGRAHWGAYAASKAAQRCFMESLADEYEAHPKLRVHGVLPGPMRTRLRRAAYPAADPASWAPPQAFTAPFIELLGPRGRGRHGEVIAASPAALA